MPFGNKADPTRKYTYAVTRLHSRRDANGKSILVAADGGTLDGEPLVYAELRSAHALHCKLVEIERDRRKRADERVHRDAELASLRTIAETAQSRVAELETALKAANQETGEKVSDKEIAAQLKAARAAMNAAWKAHKDRKSAVYKMPAVVADLTASDAEAYAASATARTEAVANGLGWGTSLQVCTRVKKSGPPPQFPRFDGEGCVSVQVQRKADKDADRVPVLNAKGEPMMTRSGKTKTKPTGYKAWGESEAFAATAGQVQFRRVPSRSGEGHDPKRVVVRIKLGGGWVEAAIAYHRPIPGEIKWAHLRRVRLGAGWRYEVQIDVARPYWEPSTPRATSGTVGVALGWRVVPGGILAATWVGDDGGSGHVIIPDRVVERWRYAKDDLRSVRDLLCNHAHETIRGWIEGRELPPEWAERVRDFARWESPRRIFGLVRWWREHRLPGDESVFAEVEGRMVTDSDGKRSYTGGRKQDRHLWDMQDGLMRSVSRWRREYYRQIAVGLAARYRTALVAEIDWAKIAKNPHPENAEDAVPKRNRALAACAKIRDEIAARCEAATVPAPGTASECWRCGGSVTAIGRMVTCERCGDETMERGENVARNLLARHLGQQGHSATLAVRK